MKLKTTALTLLLMGMALDNLCIARENSSAFGEIGESKNRDFEKHNLQYRYSPDWKDNPKINRSISRIQKLDLRYDNILEDDQRCASWGDLINGEDLKNRVSFALSCEKSQSRRFDIGFAADMGKYPVYGVRSGLGPHRPRIAWLEEFNSKVWGPEWKNPLDWYPPNFATKDCELLPSSYQVAFFCSPGNDSTHRFTTDELCDGWGDSVKQGVEFRSRVGLALACETNERQKIRIQKHSQAGRFPVYAAYSEEKRSWYNPDNWFAPKSLQNDCQSLNPKYEVAFFCEVERTE